tara:strand:+ start:13 stop:609 length:597 start_codon:yes stop_codon:yes gene_type:complete
MTIFVAITGGIGSGKSTFAKEIKKRGFSLLDSDEEVAKIYNNPNKNFLKFLKNTGFEKAIVRGKINKKYIADIIFSNKDIKKSLENYIFKIVKKQRILFIKKERRKKTKIAFFDIPLLFENNLQGKFDLVVSIISNRKNRFIRLSKSKKMSKELYSKIISSQTTDLVRKKESDIVIINNKSLKEYIQKINNLLDRVIA